MKMQRVAAFGAALLVEAACTSIFGEQTERRLGVIQTDIEGAPQFTAPDTVGAGQAFKAMVITTGSSCDVGGDTEVDPPVGGTIEMRPYDRRLTHETCDKVLRIFEHSVNVTYATPGSKILRVRGRVGPDTVVFDRTVVAK